MSHIFVGAARTTILHNTHYRLTLSYEKPLSFAGYFRDFVEFMTLQWRIFHDCVGKSHVPCGAVTYPSGRVPFLFMTVNINLVYFSAGKAESASWHVFHMKSRSHLKDLGSEYLLFVRFNCWQTGKCLRGNNGSIDSEEKSVKLWI